MIRCYPACRSLFSPSAAVCGSGAWILGSRGRNEAAGKRHPCFIIVCFVASLVIGGPVASVSQNLAITVTGGSGGSPYGQWPHGPSTSANFFPIGVWLQSPNHIAEFKGIGVNTFVGFWGSLDQTSFAAFASAGMGLIPMQNSVGLNSPEKTAIVGWGQDDEPDNAQPIGIFGHGPAGPRARSSLPTRPSAPKIRPVRYFSTLVEGFPTSIGTAAAVVPARPRATTHLQ
jgi:hypothetical protein